MNEKKLFLDTLMSSLVRADLAHRASDNALSVELANMTCEVSIRDSNVQTTDKTHITQVVTLYNGCAEPTNEMRELDNIGHWNSYTSMLSTISDKRGIGVTARLYLYENSEEVIQRLYAPLVYGAIWLSFGLSDFLRVGYPTADQFLTIGKSSHMTPSLFGIPDDAAVEAPIFSVDHLQKLEDFASERGILSFSDESGVSMELPWDRGAIGAAYDALFSSDQASDWKRTSLLMIEVDKEHPLFGRGILARLQLPIDVDNGSLPSVVNDMNLWELNAADMPPFFGSWCIDPKFSSPAYNLFIPSMFSGLVNVQNIFSWTYGRHKAAMTYLKQRLEA